MNYMVVHEQLKRGGWRTIVPDIPRIDATGAKFETRRRSAERNVRKHLTALAQADKRLPKDSKKIVRLKRTVKRCYVHFVSFAASSESETAGSC
jgi:predicted RNase H-like HicB family nuclease